MSYATGEGASRERSVAVGPSSGAPGDDARLSDAQLLTALRDGDAEAYAKLWCRHIGTALRVARRYAPGSADDLASESFLAVYRQVAVEGKGPQEAFRPYLLATMRNLAIAWSREGRLVDTDPDLDAIDTEDPLTVLHREAEAGELLTAFRGLPERWQRVLWSIEVEGVPRRQVADELAITPNAVSALTRRARAGLRLQWLRTQVPPRLGSDPAHAAAALPVYVAGKRQLPLPERRRIEAHLSECASCAKLHGELRAFFSRAQRTTLGAAGFAALAGALSASGMIDRLAAVGPAAATFGTGGATTLGAGGTTAGLGGGAGVGGGVGTGIGAGAGIGIGTLAIGGALTAAILWGGAAAPSAPPQTAPTASEQQFGGRTSDRPAGRGGAAGGDADSSSATASQEASPPQPQAGAGAALGRGVSDPAVVPLDLLPSSYEPAAKPPPAAPGTIPDPSSPGASAAVGPGLTTPTTGSGHLAPRIAGVAAPGSTVAVEYRRLPETQSEVTVMRQYAVAPGSSGAWAFDFGALSLERTGTYEYRVWAFTDAESSEPVSGTFSISPPGVTGFSGISELELAEASSTGIVFEVAGEANSTVCVTLPFSGTTATIAIDGDGVVKRRIRMTAAGFYWIVFQECTDTTRGPATEVGFDVLSPDGVFPDPFGPGMDDIVLEPVS